MVSIVSLVGQSSRLNLALRLAKAGAAGSGMACLLALAGCNSTTTSQPAVRQGHVDVTVTDKTDPAAAAYTTPDGYPDFSRPLTAANVQMSNDEAKDMGKRLSSLSYLRKTGQISQAEYERRVEEMRKLAKTNGQVQGQ
ncbi:hypothetical protein GOZ90_26705 [Agrobacterium vitis]|uniref:SHOCT domain-containing protein n=1 Tax=Agrobacterium vitis TaxID=373 RepID=A0A6L6VK99_AGRVI|nr:hypothetical protein [Agrobacterium vitis]MCF1467597.1 hypothetical protein [Agrobacterium vitis]MUZ76220.1 hypothetical protein [Agrobacterium vitis]MVA55655.1 hypothetical protein [Agrobacterium vitis]